MQHRICLRCKRRIPRMSDFRPRSPERVEQGMEQAFCEGRPEGVLGVRITRPGKAFGNTPVDKNAGAPRHRTTPALPQRSPGRTDGPLGVTRSGWSPRRPPLRCPEAGRWRSRSCCTGGRSRAPPRWRARKPPPAPSAAESAGVQEQEVPWAAFMPRTDRSIQPEAATAQ